MRCNTNESRFFVVFATVIAACPAIGGTGPQPACAPPPVVVDTDLTLMPMDLDLRQDTNGPVTTKAKFDIWNQNEIRFSGTARCVTCWDKMLLSRYGFPNHFLLESLHTDKGKARIDGMASAVCEGSSTSPLLGVAIKELTFAGSDQVGMRAAMTPVGMGTESAQILYDIISSPGELTDPSLSPAGVAGLRIGSGSDSVSIATATRLAPTDRGGVSKKGSVLFWPKAEIRWDAAGNVVQDTFLDLSNDFPADVGVQLYFVNGDPPTDAVFVGDPPILVERAHPGWNNVDVEIVLTNNEPTYWSALTGQPKGVSPLTVLDPGIQPGRPDPDPRNRGGRVLRGFVVGWAVDKEGEEIRWNHLSGSATIVSYADQTAWEYSAWAFQCVSGVARGAPCDGTPGQINMDGLEYDAGPGRLVLNFHSSGSLAFSPPDAGGPFNVPDIGDDQVLIWDADTLRVSDIATMSPIADINGSVTTCGGSSDSCAGYDDGHHMVFDTAGQRIFVTDHDEDFMVFDTALTLLSPVWGVSLSEPLGITPLPDGKLLITDEDDSDGLFRLHPDLTLDASATPGSYFDGAEGVVYDSVRDRIFVADEDDDEIEVFDGPTLDRLATISSSCRSDGPYWLGVDGSTNRLFMLADSACGSDGNNRAFGIHVFEIGCEPGDLAFIRTILGFRPDGTTGDCYGTLAVSESTDRLFAINYCTNTVDVFNTATLGMLGSVPVGRAGSEPLMVSVGHLADD